MCEQLAQNHITLQWNGQRTITTLSPNHHATLLTPVKTLFVN